MDDRDWVVPRSEIIQLRPKKSDYCVCIPIINEGDRFTGLISKLKKMSSVVDILVLDGGSNDGSVNVTNLRKNGVKALLIKKSFGKLSSQLRMGYAYALKQGYKGIITIDGNGKDDIKSIPLFIKGLREGYDYLQGSRFIKGGKEINTPLFRLLPIRLVHAPLLSLAAGFWFTDTTAGYRGYSNKYLLDPRVKPFREIFNTYELLAYLTARAPRLGLRTKEIPITRGYPSNGEVPTKISHFRGSLLLMKILIQALLGHFNPTS